MKGEVNLSNNAVILISLMLIILAAFFLYISFAFDFSSVKNNTENKTLDSFKEKSTDNEEHLLIFKNSSGDTILTETPEANSEGFFKIPEFSPSVFEICLTINKTNSLEEIECRKKEEFVKTSDKEKPSNKTHDSLPFIKIKSIVEIDKDSEQIELIVEKISGDELEGLQITITNKDGIFESTTIKNRLEKTKSIKAYMPFKQGKIETCVYPLTNTSEKETIVNNPDCIDITLDEKQSEKMMTYWGPYIDATANLDSKWWSDTLETFEDLRDVGYTHAGIHIWSDKEEDLIKSRISDLKQRGFKIALHHSAGHRILLDENQIDSENHSTGVNKKYFDSQNFSPYNCSSNCNCSGKPHRIAHDPSYKGEIWQKELDKTSTLVNLAELEEEDYVLFDTEVWGPYRVSVDWCYPGVLNRSTSTYNGNSEERIDQYFQHWSERGEDLVNEVKKQNSGANVLFYGENTPSLNFDGTWMPSGTGDASSPSWYFAPNITRLKEELKKDDFSNSYPWISFSKTNSFWADTDEEGWVDVKWDPSITQEMGYLLHKENVSGVIIYPHWTMGKEHFYEHSKAFTKGFIEGVKP